MAHFNKKALYSMVTNFWWRSRLITNRAASRDICILYTQALSSVGTTRPSQLDVNKATFGRRMMTVRGETSAALCCYNIQFIFHCSTTAYNTAIKDRSSTSPWRYLVAQTTPWFEVLSSYYLISYVYVSERKVRHISVLHWMCLARCISFTVLCCLLH